jgi:molybdenum cofactor cytidylyltransferase
VLAAGASARMGRPKLLLELEGRPLAQHVLAAAAGAGLAEIAVVVADPEGPVARALELPAGARLVANPDAASGQASSLRAGLAALGPGVGAAVVLLGDQPEVRPDAIRALLAAHRHGAGPIVRPRYSGRPGHPVLLAREVWEAAASVGGDRGARALIAERPDRLAEIEVGGDPPADVDTEEDFAALLRRRAAR